MKLRFLGAAKTVTGSCFYVESDNFKCLIDCGMYQGFGIEDKNHEPFEFDPREINFVILTHAHIDHSGLIPKLFKYGFRGKVYLTTQTAALARILLLDSAKIQEKDYNRDIALSEEDNKIYDTADSLSAIENFLSVTFFEQIDLGGGDYFRLIPAGHILGASHVLLFCEGKTLLFSGDIGRSKQSIIKSFIDYAEIEEKPDYIIGESLYGNSSHEDRDASTGKLLDIISKTLKRNGNVMVPCFALHRTQEILEILKYTMIDAGIRDNVQIFLDSPMAIAITNEYVQYSNDYNNEFLYKTIKIGFGTHKLQDSIEEGAIEEESTRLKFDNVRFVRKYKKSLTLLKGSNRIIIAGSGMADGGRILHHLYTGLENGNNSVIFVGYQAEKTLGRELVDGNKEVVIDDKTIKVKAEIHYLRGFSAHADMNDLKLWFKRYTSNKLKTVFLIHAELNVLDEFKQELTGLGYNVEIPDLLQEYIL